MKKIHYFLIVISLLSAFPVTADNNNPYQLNIMGSKVQKIGNQLQMEFTLDYNRLVVPSNDQLMVRPVIIGATDTLELPYLLFPGKIRDKVNHRKTQLYGNEENVLQPYATLYPGNQTTNTFVYRQELPFASWMYGARLELQQDVYGCADCHRILSSLPLSYIAARPRVAFAIPDIDTLREERATLYVNFPWDKAIILPHFKNNAVELEKITRCMQAIEEITNERPGKLRQVFLTGYASPEGTYTYNTRLAGQRVQAIKNYITQKYPSTVTLMVIDTIPEDWQGVRRQVDSSAFRYRSEVLDIIDHTPDPDARDIKIRLLDGNRTYQQLLKEVYPPLRRTEFVVNYQVSPLSVSQYQTIYRSHPERLSPHELYTLALSYPEASPEFDEIIFVTVRLYPQNAIANNNAAAIALQHEDLATAREYLLRCQNIPQAQNNQGVLLMLEGNLPEAQQCFREAADCGCREALLNLHNLERTQQIR